MTLHPDHLSRVYPIRLHQMWQQASFRFITRSSGQIDGARLAIGSDIALYRLLSCVSERVLDRLRQVAAFHSAVDEEGLTVRSQLEGSAAAAAVASSPLDENAVHESLAQLALIPKAVYDAGGSAVGRAHLGKLPRRKDADVAGVVEGNGDRFADRRARLQRASGKIAGEKGHVLDSPVHRSGNCGAFAVPTGVDIRPGISLAELGRRRRVGHDRRGGWRALASASDRANDEEPSSCAPRAEHSPD